MGTYVRKCVHVCREGGYKWRCVCVCECDSPCERKGGQTCGDVCIICVWGIIQVWRCVYVCEGRVQVWGVVCGTRVEVCVCVLAQNTI